MIQSIGLSQLLLCQVNKILQLVGCFQNGPKMYYSKTGLRHRTQILLQIPLVLFVGTIILIFLGLATLGTSYRTSIAKVIDASILEIVPICEYEYPRLTTERYRGANYALPCSDTAAAKRLYSRGFAFFSQHQQKLKLELQRSPMIITTLVVSNSEVGSLAVGDKLLVRVPVLRNSERVELASTTPNSETLAIALKYGAIAYGLIWMIFFLFYRRIRLAFIEAYQESTKA
jgi:hypothetical protein